MDVEIAMHERKHGNNAILRMGNMRTARPGDFGQVNGGSASPAANPSALQGRLMAGTAERKLLAPRWCPRGLSKT
jgi:hypothetical protein